VRRVLFIGISRGAHRRNHLERGILADRASMSITTPAQHRRGKRARRRRGGNQRLIGKLVGAVAYASSSKSNCAKPACSSRRRSYTSSSHPNDGIACASSLPFGRRPTGSMHPCMRRVVDRALTGSAVDRLLAGEVRPMCAEPTHDGVCAGQRPTCPRCRSSEGGAALTCRDTPESVFDLQGRYLLLPVLFVFARSHVPSPCPLAPGHRRSGRSTSAARTQAAHPHRSTLGPTCSGWSARSGGSPTAAASNRMTRCAGSAICSLPTTARR
jgi:hypothetical protein